MLKDEIFKGESKTLEFKSKLPNNTSNYLKTIIAFSNTAGGKLIIGIDDKTKNIIGVDDEFAVMDSIANAISDACKPTIYPEIFPQTIDGKTVIIVEIQPGKLPPYYLNSKGKIEGCYIRIGATSRQASQESIQELELIKRNISYDSLPYFDYEVTDECIDKLCNDIFEYRKLKLNIESPKPTIQNLINWKLIIKEQNKYIATNAFVILSQEDDTYFPYSKIQCARFLGSTRTTFLDKKEFYGPAYKLIEDAMIFIYNHLHTGMEIKGIVGSTTYEIDPSIAREIITNAINHRSYRDESAVQVSIYDDRLEITSPGSLYSDLTIEEIIAGRSKPRNKIISRIFREMGVIEEWGTGLVRVIDQCYNTGLNPPEFIESSSSFRVNIYRQERNSKPNLTVDKLNPTVDKLNPTVDKSNLTVDKSNLTVDKSNLTSNQNLIIDYLTVNSIITNRIARKLLGLSTTATRDTLNKLVTLGILSYSGERKSRKYFLSDKF